MRRYLALIKKNYTLRLKQLLHYCYCCYYIIIIIIIIIDIIIIFIIYSKFSKFFKTSPQDESNLFNFPTHEPCFQRDRRYSVAGAQKLFRSARCRLESEWVSE